VAFNFKGKFKPCILSLSVLSPLVLNYQIIPVYLILDYSMFPFALVKLGGLQAIAELLQVDCEMYGLTNDHYSVTLRRYAGMALTNLTFGDVANKVCLL
jgi:adenomatosis polyposis coli protein